MTFASVQDAAPVIAVGVMAAVVPETRGHGLPSLAGRSHHSAAVDVFPLSWSHCAHGCSWAAGLAVEATAWLLLLSTKGG